MRKNRWLWGVGASIAFFIVNLFVLSGLGQYLFAGDPFTLSFHTFTYMGLTVLCGVIVTAALMLWDKLNEVLQEVRALQAQQWQEP